MMLSFYCLALATLVSATDIISYCQPSVTSRHEKQFLPGWSAFSLRHARILNEFDCNDKFYYSPFTTYVILQDTSF